MRRSPTTPRQIYIYTHTHTYKHTHTYIHGRYLSKFADTFELRPHIRFGRKVTRLTPLLPACDDTAAVPAGAAAGVRGFAGTAWAVEHQAASTGEDEGVVREEFDVVMVCNGHYSEPYSPVLAGQDTWPGATSHSHNYRNPTRWAGKRVVVIGASASGEDISPVDLALHPVRASRL